MPVTWHSFDLKTGRRGPQLITRQLGAPERQIGQVTTLDDFQIRCYDPRKETSTDGTPTTAGAVPGWAAATLPGRTMLVALDDDQGETPLWGGMVTFRDSDLSEWVSVNLATLEAYFDRRFVKDHSWTGTAQGAIIDAILTQDVIPTGVEFIVDADSGVLRDVDYLDDDDKTFLDVLTELADLDQGPEFTVDLEWADDTHTVLNRIVRVRTRLGRSPATPVQFVYPGHFKTCGYAEDYTRGNGANDIMATSSGEGDLRPQSSHHVAQDLLDNGWCRYEDRFEPSTSEIDIENLDAAAAARLTAVKNGVNQLTPVIQYGQGPRYPYDYRLGDTVGVSITSPRFPQQTGSDGGQVPGYVETPRCVGVKLDFDNREVTPTLVEVS